MREKEYNQRGAQSPASRELLRAGGPVVSDASTLLPLAPHEERDAAPDREQHERRQHQQQNAPPCDAWAISLNLLLLGSAEVKIFIITYSLPMLSHTVQYSYSYIPTSTYSYTVTYEYV